MGPFFSELENDEPLDPKLHTAFRGAAARANYLSADRMDVQFAAKEICRWMAAPTQQSWLALKRLCRYLVGLPRLVYRYDWQTVEAIDVYTDTDWAVGVHVPGKVPVAAAYLWDRTRRRRGPLLSPASP